MVICLKYWNKQKEVRERCWTKVQDPFGVWTMFQTPKGPVGVWNTETNIWRDEHKRWCQQQPGGKFWCDERARFWYFERQQDAAWFLLKWS
jgi:hypothetical protein